MEELENMGMEPGADGGAPIEEPGIDLSQLVADTGDGNADAPDAGIADGVTHDGGAQPQPKIENQKDFNAALSGRLADERTRMQRRYESTPEYQLGQQLLRARMSKDGIGAEEAARRIQNEQIAAQAEQYQNDPKAFYADWVRAQTAGAQPPPQAADTGSPAGTISQQLIEAQTNGAMPEGFQPTDVTPDFIADAQEFGVRAALRMWQRTHGAQTNSRDAIVAELRRNQAQPQPMRPAGGNTASKPIDFTRMSDEEFQRVDAEIKRRIRNGETVRLR